MVNAEQKKRSASPPRYYSQAFKKSVVMEYERGILNKDQLQLKYGIGGNSVILNWCRKYGKLVYPEKGSTMGRPMKDPQKQRIKELEKQLADMKLKLGAYEKLIEITEREEGISILKKDGAKQSMNTDKSSPKQA
jgi:transposase-like protein